VVRGPQFEKRCYRRLDGQRKALAVLLLVKKPGTHFRVDWVSPRACLDGRVKSRIHRGYVPGTSSPEQVVIPTALFRPMKTIKQIRFYTKLTVPS
jgi:hypothetical protein